MLARAEWQPTMRTKTEIYLIAVILLGTACVLSATPVAFAETREEQKACVSDAFRFCLSAIPDRDRVFTCLMEKRSLISVACRTVMAPSLPVNLRTPNVDIK
jgi:hypothetical protein